LDPEDLVKGSKGLNEVEPAIDLAQKHHAAITGDIPALETGFDFTSIEAGKTEFVLGTIWH
jgi:hypothetical protein